MPDRFIVLSPEMLESYPVTPEMVDDLLAVSQIPGERIDKLCLALGSAPGFLDHDRLAQVVQEIVPDERLASSTVSTIENLRRETVDKAVRALRRWREARSENAVKFPEEALASLEGKLPRLIHACPALERYRKARRLAGITGSTAEGIEVICDLRPVFNENRDRVEGLIPITTLKVVYEGQDGESRSLEVLLSPEMLDTLVKKAQTAQHKLKVLGESASEWIPDGLVNLT